MNNCLLCNQPIDETAPVAIIKHVYVHLACADVYDARDLGAIDLPDEGAFVIEAKEQTL